MDFNRYLKRCQRMPVWMPALLSLLVGTLLVVNGAGLLTSFVGYAVCWGVLMEAGGFF